MSLLNNTAIATLFHGIFRMTSRCHYLGREHLPPRGTPCVLAISHLSHYDPVVVGVLLRRPIDFLARAEFYETPAARWFVENARCIRIDRYGQALPGIREALRRLDAQRLVGIFPEGEIMAGENSVLNGVGVKGGAALLSRRGSVPIIPCVVLGSDQFRRFVPWLPIRSGRLWIGLGKPIDPPVGADELAKPGRASRDAVSEQLAEALREVYRQMRERFELPEEVLP